MPNRNRYATLNHRETLSVELPNGIGVVHIHADQVEVRTGDPMIVIEVNSDTLDTPAADGRYYETRYDSMRESVFLIGRLP